MGVISCELVYGFHCSFKLGEKEPFKIAKWVEPLTYEELVRRVSESESTSWLTFSVGWRISWIWSLHPPGTGLSGVSDIITGGIRPLHLQYHKYYNMCNIPQAIKLGCRKIRAIYGIICCTYSAKTTSHILIFLKS